MADRGDTQDDSRAGRWRRRLNDSMPTRESLAENRWLKPIAHRFLISELWRFTRRSVPRGVALGLFSGFILPVGQIPLAAFLALPVRANVPIAVLTTFITNPFTFPFWLWLGNRIGKFLLQIDSMTHGEVLHTQLEGWLGEWLFWLMEQAGVTAVGLAVMAVTSSLLGYIISNWVWSWWIGRKWARRPLLRRRARERRLAIMRKQADHEQDERASD